MSQVQLYLKKRRLELLGELNEECASVFDEGFNLIDKTIAREHTDVSPAVVRRIELLEALLFGFIEHALNPALLDGMEEKIKMVRYRGARA